MVRAVKQIVTIQPGGRVEVRSDQLPEGKQAEVIVLVDVLAGLNGKAEQPTASPAARSIWEVAEDLARDLPEQDAARLPTDLAAEHDHYLYGSPKRYS